MSRSDDQPFPVVRRRGLLAAGAALLGSAMLPARFATAAPDTARWRPQWHFTPRRNWMNDPNGLVFHRGEYHLFFQHNPNSVEHARLSWGHAVSRDLVHWDELPVALEPDGLGEIYSGSAVVDERDTSGLFGGPPGGLVALYTSAGETQQQCLAHSRDDGRTWIKHPGNPVIPNPGVEDFRDPKVIWHEPTGKWVLLLAAGDRIHLYDSPNLLRWRKVSEFGAGIGAHGGVWECPDLFELPIDGDPGRTAWVLVVSINPGGPAGGSATQYFVGHFDGTTFTSDQHETRWAERGADFYAPQSWSNVPDGRRIWVGWLSNWDYAEQVPTAPWRGMMTVPREVDLREAPSGTRLRQRPVAELTEARGAVRRWCGVVAEDAAPPEFSGRVLDIVATFGLGTAARFGIDVFAGHGRRTRIGFDVPARELFVDRSASGSTWVHPSFPARHAAHLEPEDGRVRLRILVDRSCVEVFGNDGTVVLTDLVLPDEDGDRLRPFAVSGAVTVESLEVYEFPRW